MSRQATDRGGCAGPILLADDNRVSRCLAEGQLKAAGCEVITVDNGEQALRHALEDDGPRLLILDWMMPGMQGLEVIANLRRLQPDRYCYTILLTQRASRDDLLGAFESGADDVVRKPCNPAELVARVRVGRRILDLQNRLEASNAALHRQANSDSLTGLANRPCVLEALEVGMERARSLHQPLGLAMIDIDHFKAINDTHGHAVGDHVLRALAERMRGRLRDHSILGRYGGEEFLLVEPDATTDVMLRIARRLCGAASSEPFVSGNVTVPVTISIGVTCLAPNVLCSSHDFRRQADIAMYRAKHSGRNRVCLHEGCEVPQTGSA